MRYDMLTQNPPEKVEIQGKLYPINWDFRIGIKMEALLRSSASDKEKYIEILKLYYPLIPADIETAIEKVLWFYLCGEKAKEEEEKKQRYKRRNSDQPACVFSQDAPYVYAAFKQQYEIDLTSNVSLHWWKFMALFESLDEDTKMSRIMYYRKVSTSGMSKPQRAYINEMKKLYQIQPGSVKRTLEQRNQEWIEYVRKRHVQG